MAEKLIIDLEIDDKTANSAFSRIESDGKKTASILDKSFGVLTKRLLGFATAFAGAFAGVRIITQSVENFRNLETALAEVNTITNLTAESQTKLRNNFIQLSKEFGTSAQAQANTFYSIISAGITDADKANDLLIASNKLAIGGLTTSADAVSILSGAINAFGANNLDATKASDILFKTVELGQVTVGGLAQNLGRILAPASSLGVAFEDINAAVADLTGKSVPLNEAVTGLNAIFTGVLTNSAKVAKEGGRVAEAFNLQALESKRLDKFLKDVVTSVNGNQEALQKLFGSSQAVRTVLAFLGDNFGGLTSKIDNIQNSSGAADVAFQKINKTLDQVIKQLGSTFNALLLKVADTFAGKLLPALKSVIDFLNAVTAVIEGKAVPAFDNFVNAVIRVGAQLTLLAAIVNRQAIFASLASGFAIAKTSILALPAALSSARAAVIAFEIALAKARITSIALKASLTLGLSLVLDNLISSFVRFRDNGLSVFDALKSSIQVLVLTVQRLFTQLTIVIADFLTNIPLIGKDFQNLSDGAKLGLEEIDTKIDEIFAKNADRSLANVLDTGVAPTKPPIKTPMPEGKGAVKDPFEFADAFGATLKGFNEKIESTKQKSIEAFKAIGKAAKTQFAGSIGGAFAAFGKALANGENGLKAFTKAFLSAIGQQAIQLGTSFILEGIARSFLDPGTGAGLIAAGTALAVFGGALTAIGGGGSSAAAGPSAVGPVTDDRADDPFQLQEKNTQVKVDILGDVFNTRETAQTIVDIINDSFDSEGTRVARI